MWYQPHRKSVSRENFGEVRAPRPRSGDVGFYFNFDQLVWRENGEPSDGADRPSWRATQGLSVFARYGFAHGDVNRIEHFWSLGSQYVGLIPGRDDDVLAFGMAQAIISDQYHDEVDDRSDRETVYELYYNYRMTPWCVITPDLQFITNPGGTKDDRDAFVAGLRLRVSF